MKKLHINRILFLFVIKFAFLLLTASKLHAKETSTLVVYTYKGFLHANSLGEELQKEFNKWCDCNVKINWIALANSNSIWNRIYKEGLNSKADVVLGLDSYSVFNLKDQNIFSKINYSRPKILSRHIDWKNDYFVPIDFSYFTWVYDKSKVPMPNSFKAFVQMIDKEAKYKIIYSNPYTSTSGLGLIRWTYKIFGSDFEKNWRILAKNTQTIPSDWSLAYTAFLNKEADIVLSYSTSPLYHIIKEKDYGYEAACFKEGHEILIQVAGRLNSSKNPKVADKFMEFLKSKKAQYLISISNWMYPAYEDDMLPEVFKDSLNRFNTCSHNKYLSSQVDKNKSWIKAWEGAIHQ